LFLIYMSQIFYIQSGPEKVVFVKHIESKDGRVLYETDWKKMS
jgi:hypothetical protein